MKPIEQLQFNLDDPYAGHRGALNELFVNSSRYRNSKQYVELMRFISKFPRYSAYNCFLLHTQNPEVTYVATLPQWKNRFRREVKADARPLLILAPRSPVLFVYDLADTTGDELPERWKNPFEARGKIDSKRMNLTIENGEQDGIRVDLSANFSFLHAGTAFRLRSSNRILKERTDESFDFLVKINAEQDLVSGYATLAHELGHIYSGHLGNRPGDWWKNRVALSNEVVEIEAESISYLVCSRLGIETKSAEYLARFATENRDLPPVDLDRIFSVVTHIETMGEQKMSKPKQP